ncbi:coiled-coil domain-containing protein mad1 [Coemansia biformis]|uniref:Spindle assembly checkpoint component MAD1 n=1 Tax=Coemansia biformis TaxID=1286918 RepID=A0A9W7YHL6_9FUNG|nr:coiled-coil domain-containing protein mad1 [Coemansia biformis]
MLPPGDPAARAGAVPPSTVIRSRFRSITERLPATTLARGTKRYLVDDSPNGIAGRTQQQQQQQWLGCLETPIRLAPRQETPLVDTLLRPQRLFASGTPPSESKSPSRSLLESARRDSEAKSAVESLRRDAERAKFELRQVEMEREREREEALQQRQRLERDLLAQTKRVERLERDRRWLAEQEEKLAEERRAVDGEMAALRQKCDARVDKAAAAAHALEKRLDDANRALRHSRSEHVGEIERYQHRLAVAESAAAELRAGSSEGSGSVGGDASLQCTIDALRREVHEKSQDVEELQMRLRTLTSSSDDAAAATPSRTRVAQLERDLHEQCSYIQAVEQQNRQMRADAQRLAERAAKYEQEHEVNAALSSKIERLEQQQHDYARLVAQVDALQQEREQWRRVLRDTDTDAGASAAADRKPDPAHGGSPVPGLDSPLAIAKTVAAQRHTIRVLESKLESMQYSAETVAQQLQSATQDAKLFRQERARLEEEADAGRQRATRLDGARQHAVREAEFLRAQLRSYDSEEAGLMGGNYDRQKAERIAQLEQFIDEQRARIASMEQGAGPAEGGHAPGPQADGPSTALLRGYREDAEARLHELAEAQAEHQRELADVQAGHQRERDEAAAEYQRLLARFEALEREAARLEHQVGAGLGYDPRTTRILQLIDNPSAQDFAIRSQKLTSLAAENEALLERIRQLEPGAAKPADAASVGLADEDTADSGDGNGDDNGGGGGGSSGAGSAFFHTIDNLRSENRSLTQQLEDSVKLISRYRKEWRRKAAELREVVYLILGYRVDFMTNGSVRFTSTYAADVDQSFVFTSGDDNQGHMRLLGGGSKAYLKGLSNDIRYWIQERGSIPGFLATVTLQNFEAQPAQASQ